MATCRARALKILTAVNIFIRLPLVGLVASWGGDCFFREFKLEVACEKFTLYPCPQYFTIAWLIIVTLTTIFLICRLRREDFKCELLFSLFLEKYVVELVCTLLAVLAYDARTIFEVRKREAKTIILYVCFMLEHFSSVALLITLEYFPKSDGENYTYRRFKYRAILLVYALEHFVLFVLATMAATYTLVSIPTCTDEELENNSYYNTSLLVWLLSTQVKPTTNSAEPCHEAKTVSMVLLLMVLASLRYQLKEFFLSKAFEKSTQENTNKKSNETIESLDDQNGDRSKLVSVKVREENKTYNTFDAEDKRESTMEQKM